MKKMLLILCLSLLSTVPAFAVMNSADNTIGFYWDQTADTVCIPGISTTNDMHLILTNPTMDAISGFEAGFDMEGEGLIILETYANATANDLLLGIQDYGVVFGTPTICTEATLLVTITVLKTSWDWEGGLFFYLHAASEPSIPGVLPVILLPDGTVQQVALSTEFGTVNASIDLECGVVAAEKSSWSALKAMYR